MAYVATVGGALLAALPVSYQFYQAVNASNAPEAATFALWSLGVAVWAYLRLRRRPNPKAVETKVFEPFTPNEDQRWSTGNEDGELRRALELHDGSCILVVGPSGSGKSTLLAAVATQVAEQNGSAATIKTQYQDIYSALGELGLRADEHHLVVLDQFEQLLARSMVKDANEDNGERHGAVVHAMRQLLEKRVPLVVALRKEWYYDAVLFLDDLAGRRIDVLGLPNDSLALGTTTIRERLEGLTAPGVADTVLKSLDRQGVLSPLKVQIVGAAIELRHSRGGAVTKQCYMDEMGGPDGAVQEYLNLLIARVSDARVAMKVLFALAVKTRFRRQQSEDSLTSRLFEDRNAISTTLSELTDIGLVSVTPYNDYELVHDLWAEAIHELSSSELDPVERNNILSHFDQERPVVGHSSDAAIKGDRAGLLTGFEWSCLAPLAALMAMRLLNCGWPIWRAATAVPPKFLLGHHVFDESYFPIFVAHAVWAVYVALMHRRLFRRLNESHFQAALSRAVMITMTACVTAAVFVPEVWLLSIGVGGMAVGAKLLAASANRLISRQGRRELREIGWRTVLNLLIISAVGIVYAYYSRYKVVYSAYFSEWIVVTYSLSAIMTYACLNLAPQHVERKSIAKLLGLLTRQSSVPLTGEE